MEFAIQQLLLFVCLGPFAVQSTDLYSITVKDLQGNVVPMSIFKGKVGIICVNSRCVTRISHAALSTTFCFITPVIIISKKHINLSEEQVQKHTR